MKKTVLFLIMIGSVLEGCASTSVPTTSKETATEQVTEENGYDTYCEDKKQIKAFVFEKVFVPDVDPFLNKLQQIVEEKYQRETFEYELEKKNYGTEALAEYFFFPSKKEMRDFVETGANYTKLYSIDVCELRPKKRDREGRSFCLIQNAVDPISKAKINSVTKYLNSHKTIKKEVKEDQIVYQITYDLQEYCASAVPVLYN